VRLFHILTAVEWERARVGEAYRPASLATEGFIHLSTETQWQRTLARFFAGQPGMVLLEIEATGLDVRFEPADGELFPHLYAPLPIAAVVSVRAC
jgi:uncharacterized protein (DUF952 family)